MDVDLVTKDLAAPVTMAGMIILYLQYRLGALQRRADAQKERGDKQEVKIGELEGQISDNLERRLTAIEDGCKRHQDATTITQLQTVQGAMQTTLGRIEKLAHETHDAVTATATRFENVAGWIGDVRQELRNHKSNSTVHGGRSDG